MTVKSNIKGVPLTSIASTTLSNTYQAINPSGLPEACFYIRITNYGTTLVAISLDGSVPYYQIAAGGELEIYGGVGSSQPQNETCLWAKGQKFYVVGTAGTSGVIALSANYQPQGV